MRWLGSCCHVEGLLTRGSLNHGFLPRINGILCVDIGLVKGIIGINIYVVLSDVGVESVIDRYFLCRIDVYLIAGPIDASPGISPGSSAGHADAEGNEAGSGQQCNPADNK